MQGQEVQGVPIKMDAKRPTPRHIIIKILKVKDKERILKTAKEKQLVPDSGNHCQLISQKKLCRLEWIVKTYSKS